jgi:bifunctional non-homologous end joining protein LigD
VSGGGSVTVAGVEVPRADKVLYPDDGLTKRNVAEYYAEVADHMLAHLSGRPVNMQRFPDGIDSPGFYEKKRPDHFPDWVGSVRVETKDGAQDQVVVESWRALVYLAGQACLTPHTWLARSPDLATGEGLDKPDQMVFDLDPSTDDLALVRRAARAVRDVLGDLGLAAYLKTTGSRGYHVVVPLRRELGFDDVRDVAGRVATRVTNREPDSFTTEQRKDKRGDRVFVDTLRNGYGQTAVPPYALRATPGAPVATPIEWDELSRVEPDHFTISSVGRRLADRGDPWHGIGRRAQKLSRVVDDLR